MNNFPHRGEELLCVSLVRGSPYELFTTFGSYDVDFSRAAGTYLFSANGNADPWLPDETTRYWAADGVRPVVDHVANRGVVLASPDLLVSPDFLVGPDLPTRNRFKVTEIGERAQYTDRMLYCAFCRDVYPLPDNSDYLCRHSGYCRNCETWSTPEQRCSCDTRRASK